MDIADQILYEDNHLLALNKRCGQIVQGDKTGDIPLPEYIKAFLKMRDNKPGNVFCGVIHRLDRPVSGVVLFAKTSKALSRMNEAVKGRDFQKTYWALCKEAPPQESGHLENWLLRNEKNNKSTVVKAGTANAKLAILDYKLTGVSRRPEIWCRTFQPRRRHIAARQKHNVHSPRAQRARHHYRSTTSGRYMG